MKHRIVTAATLTLAAVALIAPPAHAAGFGPSGCGNATSDEFGQFDGKLIGQANSSYASDPATGFDGQVNPGKKGSFNLAGPDFPQGVPVGKVFCNPTIIYG